MAETLCSIFQAEEGTIRNKIYEKLLKNNPEKFLNTGEELASALLKDKRVLYYGDFNDVIAYDPKNLLMEYKIPDGLTYHQSPCMQRNSEFTDLFLFYMLNMRESGLMRYILGKWLPAASPQLPAGIASPISIKGVVFPFAMLVGAVLLSIGMLLVEYLHYEYCN